MVLTSQEAERLLRAIRQDDGDIPDNHTPSPDPQLDIPHDIIPGLTILRRIADGAHSVVYEAMQFQPRRRIAVKILRTGLDNPDAAKRFAAEAEILARLSHPGIVAIHHAGIWADGPTRRPYFILELIEHAVPITQYTPKLSTEQKIRLFVEVCHAVHHAHINGFIHRDLKPSNILVNIAGEPRIIDFGVARILTDDFPVSIVYTEVGQLIGTVQYMAPEQCAAEDARVDARSDVYALGLILYEILLDKPPYSVPTTSLAAAARAIEDAEPARPRTLDRAIPAPLEAVLLKAIAKSPDERYQSAHALAEDLQRFLNHEPVLARPRTRWQSAALWIAAHPIAATAIACIALILSTLLVTTLAIQLLYRMPHRIVIQDLRSRATLVSRAGAVLHEWDGQFPNSIRAATFVTPADGTDKVAFVMVHSHSHDERSVLAVLIDIRNPTESLWIAPLNQFNFPSSPNTRPFDATGEYMLPARAIVADIFPELPGDEIVIVYHHYPRFPSCIRIFNVRSPTEAPLVAEFWLPGHMDIAWDPYHAHFIVSGAGNRFPWELVGLPQPENHLHARYAMAFAPRPELAAHFLFDEVGNIDPSVRWLSVILPREHALLFGHPVLLGIDKLTDSQRLLITMGHLISDQPAIQFYLDRTTGTQISETIISSGYRFRRSANPDLPDPDNPLLQLVPVPLPDRDPR